MRCSGSRNRVLRGRVPRSDGHPAGGLLLQNEDEARWAREAEFFDREAASARIEPVLPETIQRYGTLRRSRFTKEFRFGLLGSVANKSILEIGCGDGENAMNFAKLGARVTGIDLSPKAIDVARRRAELNEVAESTRFICSPIELAELEDHSFDAIWGHAILHHLIPRLDDVLARLVRWAKPGAILVFSEPVNFSPWLRRLRSRIPVHTPATPGERPLERAEIAVIARHLPDLRLRHFNLLGRLKPFVLPHHDYERASAPRRVLWNALNLFDYAALSLPVLKELGGTAVLYGHAPSATRIQPTGGPIEPSGPYPP